jgi:secreted PhoX family phosphatase
MIVGRSLARRAFLRRASGWVLAPSLVGLLSRCTTGNGANNALGRGGYGPLGESSDAPELKVPAGFRLFRISATRQPSRADASFRVPISFDGMGAFGGPDGTVRLVRNHEVTDASDVARPFGSANVYDARAGGGTTTVELRVRGGRADRSVEVLREFPSLNGTLTNCAGGATPWGSWLSCEEVTQRRDRPHGYVFEVPSAANEAVVPVPITAMGRFVHEAVAVDPASGVVYETEDVRWELENDLPGSGFYRFLPTEPGNLVAGGRLQMLSVAGRPRYNAVEGQRVGQILPVEWIQIEDPDPSNAGEDPHAVFTEGHGKGGAVFHRLEGCWHADGGIYFDSTWGGDAGCGQIWHYRPLDVERGELELIFESPGRRVLDSPDNLCVSPRGGVLLCEDGGGSQFIRGLTREGGIFDLVETNGDLTELAGACFSPDGDVLFFNLQGSTRTEDDEPGYTFAMWGPWETGAL